MESQLISGMTQGSILHQHGSRRAFMGCYAISLVHRAVLHAQTSAVQIRHSINFRSAGVEDFFCRRRAFSAVRSQQFVEMLLSILAGEDDISRLLVDYPGRIRIICIQFHRRTGCDVHRIPEFYTLAFCCRKRNHISATSGINAVQAVATIGFRRILLKQH